MHMFDVVYQMFVTTRRLVQGCTKLNRVMGLQARWKVKALDLEKTNWDTPFNKGVFVEVQICLIIL